MEIEIIEFGNSNIVKVSDETIIKTVQDATDLLGNADYQGANRIILKETNLDAHFFNLRTGLAGEVLQKVSNYQKKLAIVGEFEKYKSNALNAFIIECNRGSNIFFMPDMESAMQKLI